MTEWSWIWEVGRCLLCGFALATVGLFTAILIGRRFRVDVEDPKKRARRHLNRKTNWWRQP